MGTSFIGIALLAAVQPAATLLYAQASATLQSRVRRGRVSHTQSHDDASGDR